MEELFPAEGPEIKILCDYIRKDFLGKKIKNFYIYPDSRYRNGFNKEIPKDLAFIDIKSKGKYIYIQLSKDMYLYIEPRNSGKLKKIHEKGASFKLESDEELYFIDPLHYGQCFLFNKEELDNKLSKVYWDSIDEDFDDKINYFYENIKFNKPITLLVMTPKMFSSLGVCLKSETFYKAKISPKTFGRDLSKEDLKRLLIAAKEKSLEVYKHNGCFDQKYSEDILIKSTFADHADVFMKKTDKLGNRVKYMITSIEKSCCFFVPEVQEIL